MTNFEIQEGEDGIGSVLILKGIWAGDVLSYMRTNNINAIRLSDSVGFAGGDLSFLSELTFLRSIEIYCWDACGLSVVSQLTELEVVGLQCKSAQSIDFSRVPKLRVAKVTWSKGLHSLLRAPSLEKLNIQNYPHEDLHPISSMTGLKRLYITSRKLKSLSGIERFPELELLDLYNCPFLESLQLVELCPKLKSLEVEACKRVRA